MKKKRILVASHERHIVRLVQLSLERHGYEVEVAYDSASCWEKVRNLLPNLIVLDTEMPNAKQVLSQLKSDEGTKDIPTVTIERQISLVNPWCGDLRLTRPTSPEELMRMIAERLGSEHVTVEPIKLTQKLAPFLLLVIFWALLMAAAALALMVWLHR